MTRKPSPLSGAARQQLLSRVKAMISTGPAEGQAGQVVAGQPGVETFAAQSFSRFTEYDSLPGFEELRLQMSVAEKMGVESPFFRVHETRAGARTVIDGRELINFSSYDYLGLNGHPEVIKAAKVALDRYGVSASASRLVAGERPVHLSLERALAEHYQTGDCSIFVSGYMTNVGVIGHLMGPRDLIVSDAAIHNSATTGSVLSNATRRSFPHNDLDALEQMLAASRANHERVLILVEGLYSMDGDSPDLARLIEIKQRYAAWLMVDEAHALGTLGARGLGLAEHCGIDPGRVDIWMGTLSKTLAGCGGYIAGAKSLIQYLKCTSGVFVYSVGLPPAIAAACETALAIMHAEPERVTRQQRNARRFLERAKAAGLDTGSAGGTAVTPVIVKDSLPAVILSQRLNARGINVQPIIYPAVPAKASRLRFFITADHSDADIDATVAAVAEEIGKVSVGNLLTMALTGGRHP